MNSTNETLLDWFTIFGSTLFLDSLSVYVNVPICLLGLVLNLLSFIIFSQKIFKSTPIFQFLRAYVLISASLCSVSATYFIGTTYYIFEFTNSHWARFYGSRIFPYLFSEVFFYSGYLDIYLGLDRLFHFIPSLKNRLNSIPVKVLFSVLLIVSLVFNLPMLFILEPSLLMVKLNDLKLFQIFFTNTSEFGKTLTAQIASYVLYFFRDVLTLVVEVSVNIATLVLLRKYMAKKQKVYSVRVASVRIVFKKSVFKLKGASSSNGRLTYMVLLISLLSSLSHFFSAYCTVSLIFSHDTTATAVCSTGFLIISVRHFANFFVFIAFNNLFLNEFLNLFKFCRVEKKCLD
jgi:hypothetical protein